MATVNILAPCILALSFSLAHADMLNISTNGFHSKDEPQIACSIVSASGPTYDGFRILYIFAESTKNGSNPALVATSLDYEWELVNLDWRSTTYFNGEPLDALDVELLYGTYLRTPYNNNDAAVIFFAAPGETLCAYSFEDTDQNGFYGVNTSITDVTPRVLASLATEEGRKFAESLRGRIDRNRLAK